MSSSHSVYNKTSKNLDIQALRGIAIIMVMIQHFRGRLPTSGGYNTVFEYFAFWGGVDLFFVISGFVITTSLLGRMALSSNKTLQKNEVFDFLKRRFIRLAPAAWFWLSIAGLYLLVFSDLRADDGVWENVKSFIAAITATANFYWSICVTQNLLGTSCPSPDINGVYWSLSLEEQFYLILAIALYFLPLRPVVIVGAAIALAITIVGIVYSDMNAFHFLWSIRPQGLVLGVIIALYSSQITQITKYIKPIIRMIVIFLLVIAICWASKAINLSITIPLLAIISTVIVILCLDDNSISWGPGKILCWIGDRSYSIYLCHLVIFHLLKHSIHAVGLSRWYDQPSSALCLFVVFVAFGLAILSGHLSYIFVERKTIKLLKKRVNA